MDNQHCSTHAISGADGVLWTLWSTRSRLEQFARGAVYTYTRCFSCIKFDMSIPRLKEMIMKVFCCATDIISFLLLFNAFSVQWSTCSVLWVIEAASGYNGNIDSRQRTLSLLLPSKRILRVY